MAKHVPFIQNPSHADPTCGRCGRPAFYLINLNLCQGCSYAVDLCRCTPLDTEASAQQPEASAPSAVQAPAVVTPAGGDLKLSTLHQFEFFTPTQLKRLAELKRAQEAAATEPTSGGDAHA
jgi:hypothetical protein